MDWYEHLKLKGAEHQLRSSEDEADMLVPQTTLLQAILDLNDAVEEARDVRAGS